jgi:hypothetical protein
MQNYSSVSEKYGYSDIARAIIGLYKTALTEQGIVTKELFIGRESLSNRIIVQSKTKFANTGVLPNFIVLAGIQSMGRYTTAQHIKSKLFPGARTDSLFLDLPRYADSIELFMELRKQVEDDKSPEQLRIQKSMFEKMHPNEQAEAIAANLAHYGDINQTVVIRSSFGLRDRTPTLKEWVDQLFRILKAQPSVTVVWISERLLSPESLTDHDNVLQFEVGELDADAMIILLSELLDVRAASPIWIKELAPKLNGHPATAHYVAKLIKDGKRSPDSILAQGEIIKSYQDKFLSDILSPESLV